MPVAPTGWPLDFRPPEVLTGILPSRAVTPSAAALAPLPGLKKPSDSVTMISAIEKLDKFRWQGRSIYAWLRQIAVNKSYDVHRRSKRTRRLADAMAKELPSESSPDDRADAQLIADEERRINRQRIAETLLRISDRYRKAIELRLIQELPRDECARKMEVTTGTFDVLLFRAVRAFRKQFGSRE